MKHPCLQLRPEAVGARGSPLCSWDSFPFRQDWLCFSRSWPFRRSAAFLLPLVQWGLSLRPIRGRLEAVVEKRGTRQRESQAGGQRTSYAWARAMSQNGQQVEAWLELGEGYHFTAASSVQAVEQVLRDHPSGALTPAQAFGADFVLNIEGIRRWPATPLAHILQENRQ